MASSNQGADMIMFEEEFGKIKDAISRLRMDANAKMVFLVDRNGQQIAAHGEIDNIDITGLASLAAGERLRLHWVHSFMSNERLSSGPYLSGRNGSDHLR